MAADGLTSVRARIAAAADRSGRDRESVRLVAVSKGRTVDEILDAYRAGQRDFGENRAQELAAKVPELPGDIRWHFVGPVQRRKVKTIRPLTHLLHSLDRIALASAWAAGESPPPATLLEVNIGAEPQKHGVLPADVDETLATVAELGIVPCGLMAIPPAPEAAADSRPWFARLRELRNVLLPTYPGLGELSMGMTDDFEVAIEEGASMIRVGRAIFEG
jgi:pyridoxal phosphate enzyme (YggS family)